MKTYTTKTGHERLVRIENSWDANAPDTDKFGDVSLTEIKTDKLASDAKKDEIMLAEERVRRLKIEHADMIESFMEKCDYVVRNVEADRRFGQNSALYAGFGYIRTSERKKGGRRKPANTDMK